MSLSKKQIESITKSNKRFNIWVGAVRSGKTFASILRLIDLLKNGPPGDVMIIGVNRESIQRNILGELYKFLGFSPPPSKNTESTLYNRRVYFVGAHDEGSVRRIQGSTLAIAYVDEATCLPEAFWKMLETRLSVPGARLLATCNPESPAHWLKKHYIDRSSELSLSSWHFNLDDNPSLDEEYKSEIRKSLTGAFYKRYVLGEWTAASGLIYDSYCTELNEYENLPMHPNWRAIGLDYGTSNATAAVMIGCTPTIWPQIRVEKEYYWDSAKEGRSKTDAELAEDIKKFIGYHDVRAIYVDPAAASMKLELRRMGLPVLDAVNDVLFGIKIVSKFIQGKNLVIHKSCVTLREHIQGYIWDLKASDQGKDKPLKVSDHICLSGDTVITLDQSRSFKIKEMIGMHGDIINYDFKSDLLSLDKFANVQLTREKAEVIELELEDGKKLIATPDHKVLTKRGMVCLKDLMLSDIVLVCNNTKSTTENNSI